MKLIPRFIILTCVLVCAACKVLPLPAYIKPCYKNDPNLNDCATKNGQAALPTLIKGDRSYRIPMLDPLAIDELLILNGNGSVAVDVLCKNVKAVGLKEATLKNVKLDPSKKVIILEMFTPRFSLLGDYKINGKILVLPIVGSGLANVTLENLDFTYTLTYNLVKKADGLEYAVPNSNNMEFVTTRAHLLFDNLFNGDKALSDNMNKFLNENWMIINEELGPSIAQSIGDVLQAILTHTLEDIPYKNIFLTES